MITIDGKSYHLWSQLVEGKDRWIGQTLESFEDGEKYTTEVTDIYLTKCGESVVFGVDGKDFGCSFNVEYGGITSGDEGWLTLYCYGHTWRMRNPKDAA